MAQAIEAERKARSDSEDEIVDMLKDMITKVRGELENEQTERGKNEDVLLGLLETTCQKLNKQGEVRASQRSQNTEIASKFHFRRSLSR